MLVTFFSRKSCLLGDNVEEYGKTRHVTEDNMTHVHCILNIEAYKHTHTHNMEYSLRFHRSNGCTNVPQCYVIRSLHFLYVITLSITGEMCRFILLVIMYNTVK
jgi:hypothetical protein